MEDLRKKIQEKYARAIREKTSCCNSKRCCCEGGLDTLGITEGNYDEATLREAPESLASQSFGCGNPLEEAHIHPGETVLDLGSGVGLDLFLASQAVGPWGHVIGLDMTDEMLAVAKENVKDLKNVSLLRGYIEDMPLKESSVDVIISNCVINLSPDKNQVFREAFRVLRPGGRFCVSDTVFLRPVSEKGTKNLAAWSGCISGALPEMEYRTKMEAAGFRDVRVKRTKTYAFSDSLGEAIFPELSPEERKELDGALASAIILGKKSCSEFVEGKDYTLRTAEKEDVPAMKILLEGNGLTSLGIPEHPERYFLLEHSGIAAMAGMETHGEAGLLRSLAVRYRDRKKGFGKRLVREMLRQAQGKKLRKIYLLTETAEPFFAELGFTVISRKEIPSPLLESSALNDICPQSSVVMKKELL